MGDILLKRYETNEIVETLSLAGDKLIPEIYVRGPAFVYNTCQPFTKYKKRIQKFRETGDSRYIYPKKVDKACFPHDMVYEDLNSLTVSDKLLRDKAFNF